MNINEAFHDPVMQRGYPASIFTPDQKLDGNKPVVLVYASCHGRTLAHYLDNWPPFRERYNLVRLETGPMMLAHQAGLSVFDNPALAKIFWAADIIITYNMGARMGPLALNAVRHMFKPTARVITFTAPNCSCFWPIADGYAGSLGVLHAFDRRQSVEEVWFDFQCGVFQSFFLLRYRIEIGRLIDKDAYHDIGLSNFVIRNHRKARLWASTSHPTYVTIGYIGSQVCRVLDLLVQAEEDVLRLDPTIETMRGQPDTQYEFDHYRFEFPRRKEEQADEGFYLRYIQGAYEHWKDGAFISPPVD